MNEYSETAWRIASLYSHYLASETWDLAAHIDVALAAEREACAEIADYWGDGNWRVKFEGRSRFDIYHMQNVSNTTGRGIAEEIRERGVQVTAPESLTEV